MTAGEYGTGYADRLGNSAWRWIALFLARSAGGQCVRWCGCSRSCPSPARFRSCGERGRIASGTPPCLPRWGGDGTALAVTERAFFPLPTPSHVVALSVGFAASSPRGGEPSWVRFVRGCVLVWCIRFGRLRRSSSVSPSGEPPSPEGEGFSLPSLFGAGGCFYAAPLIRHGFAVPPSPEGEGIGAAARPTKCWSTTRYRTG